MEKLHIGIIGIIAGIFTTVSFVPQLVKIFKTKRGKDISLYMYVVLTTGIVMWLIYGFLIKELPIILANAVAFVLCSIIILMRVKYRD